MIYKSPEPNNEIDSLSNAKNNKLIIVKSPRKDNQEEIEQDSQEEPVDLLKLNKLQKSRLWR